MSRVNFQGVTTSTRTSDNDDRRFVYSARFDLSDPPPLGVSVAYIYEYTDTDSTLPTLLITACS